MRKLRLLVAVHETLIPPSTLAGHEQREIDEWRTEFDVVSHLTAAGHDVRCIGLLDSLTELRTTIQEWRPHIVFNLLEEFDGIAKHDQHVVAFLELMRQPYTGCNPRGLMLSRDKVLSKQLLAYHRIPTPQFAVFPRGKRVRVPPKTRFPLFVKSATDDASLGIAQASVCSDAASLKARIEFVHEQTDSDALVEEYVEGREIYVGVLGNDRLTTLPPWEMSFGSLPEGQAPIATRKVKWDRRYQVRHGITTDAAVALPDGVLQQLGRLTKRIYRALHLTGYARMDFRLRADGALYVLEANANPNLAEEEDLARSARAAGIDYDELLSRILSLGLGYQAAWRANEE
ncbi:MAG: D-alanine--D-alanine ligase [Proteobacteria bacterium]|nr:D-alanine--D-alanine ligase [Pseudomonadota bacterium]